MAKRGNHVKLAERREAATAKLTLTIPLETAKRFGVHAEMVGLSKSQLFAEMIRSHCRRFIVSDRDRERERPGDMPGLDPEGEGTAGRLEAPETIPCRREVG